MTSYKYNIAAQQLTSETPRKGFTLIEMLVVMVIIAILFLLIIGTAEYAKRKSMEGRTAAMMEQIQFKILDWKMSHGTLPANLGVIASMLPEGFSFSNGVPCDAWMRPYVYTRNEEAYILYSTGYNPTNSDDDIESGN